MQSFLVTKILSQYCRKWASFEVSYSVYRILKYNKLEEFTLSVLRLKSKEHDQLL